MGLKLFYEHNFLCVDRQSVSFMHRSAGRRYIRDMMKQNPALKIFALLAVSIGLLPVDAGALPIATPQKSNLLVAAAGDCAAVGEQVAASQGGQMAKATPTTQNGRAMCVIVVLVPGRDGERPRRVEVAVPAQ
jgi:hypothetical protein